MKNPTFMDWAEDVMGFFEDHGVDLGQDRPEIEFDSTPADPYDVFVPTGHYDFVQNKITLHVAGRQAKDVMRTLCHELVHVWQWNRDPEAYESFDKSGNLAENPELLKYEREAYAVGNVLFRMWTEARAGRRI